jgi:hypothetical protein
MSTIGEGQRLILWLRGFAEWDPFLVQLPQERIMPLSESLCSIKSSYNLESRISLPRILHKWSTLRLSSGCNLHRGAPILFPDALGILCRELAWKAKGWSPWRIRRPSAWFVQGRFSRFGLSRQSLSVTSTATGDGTARQIRIFQTENNIVIFFKFTVFQLTGGVRDVWPEYNDCAKTEAGRDCAL